MYERIRDLREDKDLTQQGIANILSISQSTYSRYESGTLDIPSISLIKLSVFHKTSIDYIVGRTNEKKPYPYKTKRER
ncbi:MAG: helix-turn-helix domain-containing protein [Defluviitaleaceae bacterium]|nr:helix-turn-helix domain-containing protein [Defluviitaleaceae bacterium]